MRYPKDNLTDKEAAELKAIGERHKSQSDKFRDLAREVEADEDEKAFDEKLRRMRERKAAEPEEDTDAD